jgi:hypothetical protein
MTDTPPKEGERGQGLGGYSHAVPAVLSPTTSRRRGQIHPNFPVQPRVSVRAGRCLVHKLDRRNKKGMPEILSDNGHFFVRLDGLNVLGLPALWSLGHVELHRLPFLQAAKAACLNSGEMHEDILAILSADEAIALGVVKPLYCSLFCHLIFLFPFS